MTNTLTLITAIILQMVVFWGLSDMPNHKGKIDRLIGIILLTIGQLFVIHIVLLGIGGL